MVPARSLTEAVVAPFRTFFARADALPIALFLVDLGFTRGQIGLLSSVSLPWTLKFLWAPLVDRFALPWPGRRRSWVILTQLALAVAMGGLAAFAWRTRHALICAANCNARTTSRST